MTDKESQNITIPTSLLKDIAGDRVFIVTWNDLIPETKQIRHYVWGLCEVIQEFPETNIIAIKPVTGISQLHDWRDDYVFPFPTAENAARNFIDAAQFMLSVNDVQPHAVTNSGFYVKHPAAISPELQQQVEKLVDIVSETAREIEKAGYYVEFHYNNQNREFVVRNK